MATPKGTKATLRSLDEIKRLEKELGLKPKPYDPTKQGTWQSQRSNRITKTLSNKRKRATPEQRQKEYDKKIADRADPIKGEEVRAKAREDYKKPHVRASKSKHSTRRRERERGAKKSIGILDAGRETELDQIRQAPGIFNWRDTNSAPSDYYPEGKNIPYFETEHDIDVAKGGGDWDVKRDRPNIYTVDRPTHARITKATEQGKDALAQDMKSRARLPTVTGPARDVVMTPKKLKSLMNLKSVMPWLTIPLAYAATSLLPEQKAMAAEDVLSLLDPLGLPRGGRYSKTPGSAEFNAHLPPYLRRLKDATWGGGLHRY